MGRRLLYVLDAALVAAAAFLAFQVYGAWRAAPAVGPTPPVSGPAGGGAPAPSTAAPAPQPPMSAFAVVTERNLFSPNRSEAPPEPPRAAGGAPAAPPAPKPRLYGVVLLPDGKARAYLEDVQRRRIFGYSVGDAVAGSQVEQIQPDRVLLRRGAESFEVLLRDPTKPKPAAPAAAGGAARPGAPVAEEGEAPGSSPGAAAGPRPPAERFGRRAAEQPRRLRPPGFAPSRSVGGFTGARPGVSATPGSPAAPILPVPAEPTETDTSEDTE